MELDGSVGVGTRRSGRLIMAALSHVFTISRVAAMLGEDEDWLHELSIDMFPEDGCLTVYGTDEDGVTAFTDYGVESLQQLIEDERAAGRAPEKGKPPKPKPP